MNDYLKPITLCYGVGTEGESACWMATVSQFLGYGHGDQLECASPAINSFCIAINDAFGNSREGQKHRTRVIVDGGRLFDPVGTLDPESENRRRYILIDAAIRIFAPFALRLTQNPAIAAHALALESLAPIVDEATRLAARAAANAAAAAAAAKATARSEFIETHALPVLDRMIAAGKHAPRESVPEPKVTIAQWHRLCGVGKKP